MLSKTKNQPLSLLLCFALLLNYSYLPVASAQENPPIPPNSLTLSSASTMLDMQNIQQIQGVSVDLKASKIRPAAGRPPAGIKPAGLKGKIRGISIAASDNRSKITDLQAKPGRLDRAKWRKQSVSLARSPQASIKTANSLKLTQLEANWKGGV